MSTATARKATVHKLPVEPTVAEVEGAAYALNHASIILRSTPRHPEVAYLYEARIEVYRRAVDRMREVLGNG